MATYFQVTLADLLSNAQVGGTPILGTAGVLTPAGALVVPPLVYAVQTDPSVQDKTLQQVAARFGVAVAVLAAAPANAGITGLFATVDADQKKVPYLDVPHLPKFRLLEIMNEIQ